MGSDPANVVSQISVSEIILNFKGSDPDRLT